ncbi:MAG TPA: hypothetical protein VF815_20830 [Myxococcaceae bacterium]|jgi:hypothetical protein
MATHDTDAPARLPVKLDSTTNGEYWPRPVPAALEQVRQQVLTQSEADSRRMGISRRDYLASTCGAAAVFLAMNQLGCTGGRFQVPDEARHDRAAADAAMGGNGYPALTRERKAKIFGLNGARVYEVNPEEIRQAQRADAVSRARTMYAEAPAPSLQTYGPRTRREMLRLLRFTGGRPD